MKASELHYFAQGVSGGLTGDVPASLPEISIHNGPFCYSSVAAKVLSRGRCMCYPLCVTRRIDRCGQQLQ